MNTQWKLGEMVHIKHDFTKYFGQRLGIVLDTHCDLYGKKDLQYGTYYKVYVQNEMCESLFQYFELENIE